jgi:hypothetical protein
MLLFTVSGKAKIVFQIMTYLEQKCGTITLGELLDIQQSEENDASEPEIINAG